MQSTLKTYNYFFLGFLIQLSYSLIHSIFTVTFHKLLIDSELLPEVACTCWDSVIADSAVGVQGQKYSS